MKRHAFGIVLAGMALTVAGAAAQAPQPTPQAPPQTPPTRQSPTPQSQRTEQARSITIEGCLVREADVPGRRPNVAERAGIGEDYVLTSTRMIKGTAPAGSAANTQRPGDQPVGTSGTSTGDMYEIDGIDDEQLKPHVGRRVQIDGTFDDLDDRDRTATDPNADLPDIEASAIRPASGTCPGQ